MTEKTRTLRRKPGRKAPPTVPAFDGAGKNPGRSLPALVASDPEKQARAREVIQHCRETFDLRPVRSNADIVQRAYDYFDFCQERGLYPTVEGLAAFFGYSTRQINRWEKKESAGFSDGDLTTSQIIERLKNALAMFDAQLALEGSVNAVAYIFRQKALQGYVDNQRIEVITGAEDLTRAPLSPEEIARRLPDPDADYTLSADDYRH